MNSAIQVYETKKPIIDSSLIDSSLKQQENLTQERQRITLGSFDNYIESTKDKVDHILYKKNESNTALFKIKEFILNEVKNANTQEFFIDKNLKEKIIEESYLKNFQNSQDFQEKFNNFLKTFILRDLGYETYLKIIKNGGILFGKEKRKIENKISFFYKLHNNGKYGKRSGDKPKNNKTIISNSNKITIESKKVENNKINKIPNKAKKLLNFLNEQNLLNKISEKSLDDTINFYFYNKTKNKGKINDEVAIDIDKIDEEGLYEILDLDDILNENFKESKENLSEFLSKNPKFKYGNLLNILHLLKLFLKDNIENELVQKNKNIYSENDINLIANFLFLKIKDLINKDIINLLVEKYLLKLEEQFEKSKGSSNIYIYQFKNLGIVLYLKKDIGIYSNNANQEKKLPNGSYKIQDTRIISSKVDTTDKSLKDFMDKYRFLIGYRKNLKGDKLEKINEDINYMRGLLKNALVMSLKEKLKI